MSVLVDLGVIIIMDVVVVEKVDNDDDGLLLSFVRGTVAFAGEDGTASGGACIVVVVVVLDFLLMVGRTGSTVSPTILL